MLSRFLVNSVKRHEGLRTKAYQCSEGIWTIGYGRNLQELRITKGMAEKWLREDLEKAEDEASEFPEYEYLDNRARKDVFVEMVFNLGAPRLRGFRKMLQAIRLQDWNKASEEMLDSLWAKQVGQRANRLAKVMKNGRWT